MYHLNFLLINLISTIFFTTCSAAPVEAALAKRSPAVPRLSGAAVSVGPGTYPRANKLSDGSILAAYTAFEGGYNIIRVVISTNNGQSWYVSDNSP